MPRAGRWNREARIAIDMMRLAERAFDLGRPARKKRGTQTRTDESRQPWRDTRGRPNGKGAPAAESGTGHGGGGPHQGQLVRSRKGKGPTPKGRPSHGRKRPEGHPPRDPSDQRGAVERWLGGPPRKGASTAGTSASHLPTSSRAVGARITSRARGASQLEATHLGISLLRRHLAVLHGRGELAEVPFRVSRTVDGAHQDLLTKTNAEHRTAMTLMSTQAKMRAYIRPPLCVEESRTGTQPHHALASRGGALHHQRRDHRWRTGNEQKLDAETRQGRTYRAAKQGDGLGGDIRA